MHLTEEKSRDAFVDAIEFAAERFSECSGFTDAEYLDGERSRVFAVCGLPARLPVALPIMNDPAFAAAIDDGKSHLVVCGDGFRHLTDAGEAPLSPEQIAAIAGNVSLFSRSVGEIDDDGAHVIDLKSPEVSPHYRVNLLLGNRVGYENPLITTPKSAVDALGGGSFRAHADKQVLATRAVMRMEENGEPANRQFYIVEDGRQIFFSANPNENVAKATCRHLQNRTVIEYDTECGLHITRTIFILPQYDDMPQATEVQRITVENRSGRERKLKIVATGMIGVYPTDALFGDVVYVMICHESAVLKNGNKIAAIAPSYWPRYRRFEKEFATLIADGEGMDEYSVSYDEFYGAGDVAHPQNVAHLTSRPKRKKAPFFAMAKTILLGSGEKKDVNTFVGCVTEKEDCHEAFYRKVGNLIDRFSAPGELEKALDDVISFYERYASYLRIDTGERLRDVYINKNLPFQVLYQSFVSRSFAWTQKSFRRIGFREIQDVYASMYYLAAMGEAPLVREMIAKWAENVFEMGYANHNFYEEGMQPGQCSDDQLWLVQAVYRYITLTGDTAFLDESFKIAGSEKKRALIDTLRAVVIYSGMISVGEHGLPLLDEADWNDCLRLDPECVDGPTKEKLYRAQLERTGGKWGDRFESRGAESVMNAFLLAVALRDLAGLCDMTGRGELADEYVRMLVELHANIEKHAWKGNFYARALLNGDKGYTYVGAAGDGLSLDPAIDGSYFLNCFSWALLADCAAPAQVASMLDVVEKYLKTDAGFMLSTPCDLDKISSHTATEHYFPGDRENGAVFKHATMMATAAMFSAAREIADEALAARLTALGHWMLDRVYPFKAMEDPFVLCGNPRFCTQYNNSVTRENVGPMLSGTASWLSLSVTEFLGIEFAGDKMLINPLLPEDTTHCRFELNRAGTRFTVEITKPKGFARLPFEIDGKPKAYTLDGESVPYLFDAPTDGGEHTIRIEM